MLGTVDDFDMDFVDRIVLQITNSIPDYTIWQYVFQDKFWIYAVCIEWLLVYVLFLGSFVF